MRMKTFVKPALAVMGMLTALSGASGQSPTPPEPRQPLLPRAPALASWTVAFKYSGEEKPSESNPPPPPPPPPGEVPHSIVITKVNTVYREQIELATGAKVERWDFAGTQFGSDSAGSVFLNIAPAGDSPDSEYYDRRRSDFPELSWISKATYRGVENFKGRPAFHFETEKNGSKLSAYLSLDSQMPLWFFDGMASRTYTFNPPPTGPLVPPPAFAKAYNRHKQAMEALNYRPSPP